MTHTKINIPAAQCPRFYKGDKVKIGPFSNVVYIVDEARVYYRIDFHSPTDPPLPILEKVEYVLWREDKPIAFVIENGMNVFSAE